MELRYQFGTLHHPVILAAAALLALTVGCESSPSAPSPSIANVAGTWLLQSPAEISQTTMVLEQNGSTVTGTWSRTIESLMTSGTVSGTATSDRVTIRADLVTRDGGSAPCATLDADHYGWREDV